MSGLPRIAGDVLQLFGVEPALIGDLDESARSGRSRFWCWYQVTGVLCVSSLQLGLARPAYSVRGIAIGWVALLSTFMVIDAPVINNLRLEGYRTGEWTPFWIVAAVLSYLGFALSAWIVARLHRAVPGVLLQYTATGPRVVAERPRV